MNISADTFTILLFLIPGLLSSVILKQLVVRPESTGMSRIIESLIFSFFVYLAVYMFTNQVPVKLESTQVGSKTVLELSFNPTFLVPVAALSVVFPIALAYFITHDLHMRFFRKIRATHLTSRTNIWLDVFSDLGNRFVVVNLTDGRRVIGLPTYSSDSRSDEKALYLYKAAWITADGNYQRLPGHGLFIVKGDLIATIEFLDVPEPIEKSPVDKEETDNV